MLDAKTAKEDLLKAAAGLQKKRELSVQIGPDYYDPGNMEYLDQFYGHYDAETNTLTIQTDAKGLRYEGRTQRLDDLTVNDAVHIKRDPQNAFNANNLMLLTETGESLGNLSAELCNVISPLLDLGFLSIKSAEVCYLERIRDRSRYAKQGVLFVKIEIEFHGV